MISMTSTTEKQFGVKTRSRRLKDNDEPEILTKKRRVQQNGSTEKMLSHLKPETKCRKGRSRSLLGVTNDKTSGNCKTLRSLTEEDNEQIEDMWSTASKKMEQSVPPANTEAEEGELQTSERPISSSAHPFLTEEDDQELEDLFNLRSMKKEFLDISDDLEANHLENAVTRTTDSPKKSNADIPESIVVDQEVEIIKEVPPKLRMKKLKSEEVVVLYDSMETDQDCECKENKYDALLENYKMIEKYLAEAKQKTSVLQKENDRLEEVLDKTYLRFEVKPKQEEL
ncbi:hypothetical protein QR680_019321 [Steinernema hermaphroditum]|uniref:Uncharacterized protein n=1 Tax=Steinernema hermaphroditum TaxID=289476 RepID=A0AA39LAA0_9BILA|nr:hypothetical protein QR680_019321 [Steinernema hermaphroditum]